MVSGPSISTIRPPTWHLDFGAADDRAQVVAALKAQGLGPTDPIDRCFFRSVYFRSPGRKIFPLRDGRTVHSFSLYRGHEHA
jgi:hypothetical protein